MQDQQKQWAKIVAKTWMDDNYKARLLADPAAVLAEEGARIQAKVRVVEAGVDETVLVLPSKPMDPQDDHGKVEERLAASVF